MKSINRLILFIWSCCFFNCENKRTINDPNKGVMNSVISPILNDPIIKVIDSIVISHQQAYEVPGLAIGIIKDNKWFYFKGVGVQGLDSKAPLNEQSLFHMASVSKPFVATAIMQLVEAGKLKLDERLVTYLPYFIMDDEHYQTITLRQMLNHTSGIPDVEDYEWDNPQYDDSAAERYAKSFATEKLDFAPGEKYSYSNAAFDILADVIARASGMTFEAYMKKYIFEPIGMVNSTFYKPDVPGKLATKPHILGDSLEMSVSDIYPYNRIHAPSSTLHSNINDMLLWAKVNLNQGEINGERIYSKASYNLLTAPEIKTGYKDYSICLSWFSGYFGDHRMIMHTGGDRGYRTYFGLIPEKGIAVAVMANNEIFRSWPMAYTILEKLLDVEINNWKIPIHFKLKNFILTKGIEQVKTVYFQEKKNNPDQYIFEGWCLDDLGYWLVDRGYYQKALEVFKFNVDLDSKVAGWYDSVADAYRAMDNKEMAIEWYKKALAIDPNLEFSKRKLSEMMNE